jgi:argininosuccinate lyase
VLLSHHLNAHAWSLLRDVDRLMDARVTDERLAARRWAHSRARRCRSTPGDRGLVGIRGAFANSMDAVSDRDFVAETLFDIALLGVHLSRMGEELVLVDERRVQLRHPR